MAGLPLPVWEMAPLRELVLAVGCSLGSKGLLPPPGTDREPASQQGKAGSLGPRVNLLVLSLPILWVPWKCDGVMCRCVSGYSKPRPKGNEDHHPATAPRAGTKLSCSQTRVPPAQGGGPQLLPKGVCQRGKETAVKTSPTVWISCFII